MKIKTGEQIWFKRVLSIEEKEKIEDYLIQKYELYDKIPPRHPTLQRAVTQEFSLSHLKPSWHFVADKGVITDKNGNVIAWINQAQPWYRRWWQMFCYRFFT